MRFSVCSPFLVLAIFCFFLYLFQSRPQFEDFEPILALVLTGLLSVLFYALLQFLQRLFRNRTLWRIILILFIIGLIGLALYLSEISLEGARLLVFAVLLLILYGYCRTRPERSAASSG